MNTRLLINHLTNPPKYFSVSLLLILAVFHLRFGLLPAWQNINSDFPNYYTSSKLLIYGEDLSNLYDDAWFQGKINEYGINEQGKFSPFPPATAFVMLPEAFFNPITAKRIYLVFNLFVLVFTSYLLKKISGFSFLINLNFLLLSGIALVNNLLLGQFYLILLMLIVLDYVILIKKKEHLTGYFWGIGAAIKYFPLAFIPVLAFTKKWKTISGMLAAVIIVNFISFFVVGSAAYKTFFDKVFFSHLNGELSSQSMFAVQFQSWNSLLRHIFVYDPVENTNPLLNSTLVFDIARAIVYLLFISAAIYAVYKIKDDRELFPKSIAVSALLMFVLSPASASYHLLLLVFPAILLIVVSIRERKYEFTLIFILLYVLIGFVPLVLSKINIESLVFQYYRLWLNTVYFIAAVFYMLYNNTITRRVAVT